MTDAGGPATADAVGKGKRFDPEAEGWTLRHANPFFDRLGLVWTRRVSGEYLVGIACTPYMLNGFGRMHGGAMSALCDQVLGCTIEDTILETDEKVRSVTVQMNVQYTGPVCEGDFVVAHCRLIRRTRSLIFIDGVLDVRGEPVATVQAVFKLVKPWSAPKPMRQSSGE